MGKIGDLWVKLGLKKEGFDAGLGKAKKSLKSFAGGLGSLPKIASAAGAAIGAAFAAVAASVIKSSQRISDSFDVAVSEMKAGWDVFIDSLANWKWDNFIGRIKGAAVAAKELTQVLDAAGETENSLIISRAENAEKLAQLRLDSVDPRKTYEERKKAAEEYLAIIKPLYDKEIKMNEDVARAQVKAWVQTRGISAEGREGSVVSAMQRFLRDDAENAKKLSDLYHEMGAEGTSRERWAEIREYFASYSNDPEYNSMVGALAEAYQRSSNDKEISTIVGAMTKAMESRAAFISENKRIFSALNSAESHIDTGFTESVEKGDAVLEAIKEDAADLAHVMAEDEQFLKDNETAYEEWRDSVLGSIGAVSAEVEQAFGDISQDGQQLADSLNAQADAMEQRAEALAESLKVSIAYGMSDAIQTFADSLAGLEDMNMGSVLQSLLTPIAELATREGEILIAQGIGIESIKTALASLNGAAAIAAGTALVAIGAAAKSGLQALANGGNTSAGVNNYSGGGSYAQSNNIQTELTVYVKGKLSGSDIVLAGQSTMNQWSR